MNTRNILRGDIKKPEVTRQLDMLMGDTATNEVIIGYIEKLKQDGEQVILGEPMQNHGVDEDDDFTEDYSEDEEIKEKEKEKLPLKKDTRVKDNK